MGRNISFAQVEWSGATKLPTAVRMAVTLHTNVGDLKLELFCDEVPKSTENFLALCASGKYDGTVFHRVIKGFLVQGGDPTNTGDGGQSIWGAPYEDEIVDHLRHDRRGVVSMANSGPDTNESQFFITFAKQRQLDGKYTVFGKVINGFDVLDVMERAAVDEDDRPLRDMKIERVTIHANPIA